MSLFLEKYVSIRLNSFVSPKGTISCFSYISDKEVFDIKFTLL